MIWARESHVVWADVVIGVDGGPRLFLSNDEAAFLANELAALVDRDVIKGPKAPDSAWVAKHDSRGHS